MFDFVRKHNKFLMVSLLLLIIPSFGFFGIESVIETGQRSEAVARVDGRDITRVEWDQAHEEEARRLREAMPNIDARLLDSDAARYATLERLVRDRVLAAAAQKYHLYISDQRLAEALQRDQAVAALRRPDGTLDVESYRQLLANQGMTPEIFEARVRSDLSLRQVSEGITTTSFAPAGLVASSLDAFFERREVSVQRFSAADYAAQVQLTDAEIETFYNANTALFQAPEQVDIEYLVLDTASLTNSVKISEADVRAYYDQNAARLSGNEERRASHILLTLPASASPADKDKARQKLQALLDQLRQDPTKFAELAKSHSQDTGSAPQGGDLGFFSRGAMVKPFEDAVFSLKKGEISNIVESEFGFHIIALTDIKSVSVRSLESMRSEIEADLKKRQAQKLFTENAEVFSNLVYEQADTLKVAAERLNLTLQTAQGVTRKPRPGIGGVLTNEKLLAALFAPDSVERKQNTEAIETGSGQLVAARVTKHQPARTLPLSEIRDQVRVRLVTQRATELANQAGKKQLEAWKAGADTEGMPGVQVISRDAAQGVPPAVLKAAMSLLTKTLPAWVGVDLGAEGYAVVRVDKLLPPAERSAELQQQIKQQYNQLLANAEGQAFYETLKERFKVKILAPAPAQE